MPLSSLRFYDSKHGWAYQKLMLSLLFRHTPSSPAVVCTAMLCSMLQDGEGRVFLLYHLTVWVVSSPEASWAELQGPPERCHDKMEDKRAVYATLRSLEEW